MKGKVVAVFTILAATNASAGVLASTGSTGVLGSQISVCFVGDAPTTRATFITQIKQFLKAHEGVANVNYTFLPSCPAPSTDANGNDLFSGDLRVVLMGTNVPYSPPSTPTSIPIPGKGCTRSAPAATDSNGQPVLDASGNQVDSGSSFGIFPSDRSPEHDIHCLWNMRLGNDGDASGPFRNHSLHEFGHSLGFAHEFERSDAAAAAVAANCDATVASRWISGLPSAGHGNNAFTSESYDLSSTMNYTVNGCPGYVGNYSNVGLGELEKISLHFMYPENQRVAEFVGKTVLTTGETSVLRGLWEARGAALTVNKMLTTYFWIEGSSMLSSAPSITLAYPNAGNHQISLVYIDYIGRAYAFSFTVRVLTPTTFTRTIAGPVAASLPLE